jgi:hypothetical protein
MRTLAEILAGTATIALVGASPRPERPSNSVMRYLLDEGYRVIPVRPNRREVLGVACVGSLQEIDEPIDIVDVFRSGSSSGSSRRRPAGSPRRAASSTSRTRAPPSSTGAL